MEKNGKIGILFICLGNICRSPAAQGVMQHFVDQRNLTEYFNIDSAGEGSWHVGDLPDRRMRAHGGKRGYEFTHRARQFRAGTDFDRFDFIVTMDDENFRDISAMANGEEQRGKVVRMSGFFERFKGADSVPDPYYGGADAFERALDLIEDGCQNLLDYLIKKYNLRSYV